MSHSEVDTLCKPDTALRKEKVVSYVAGKGTLNVVDYGKVIICGYNVPTAEDKIILRDEYGIEI